MVALATSSLQAQVSTFQANIPFPFVVGSETLPAGAYLVQRFLGRPKSPEDIEVIVLKTSDHHVYKVIVTGSGENQHPRSARSRLVFTSFKGKQYLNCVWVSGDSAAHQVASVPPEIADQSETEEVIVTGVRGPRGK